MFCDKAGKIIEDALLLAKYDLTRYFGKKTKTHEIIHMSGWPPSLPKPIVNIYGTKNSQFYLRVLCVLWDPLF